jgi:hypothetical protein
MTKAWKCVFASTAAALRGSFIVPTNSWLCGTRCRFMGPKRRLAPPDTKHGGFAPPSCRERRKKLSSGLIAQRRARIEANSCAMRVCYSARLISRRLIARSLIATRLASQQRHMNRKRLPIATTLVSQKGTAQWSKFHLTTKWHVKSSMSSWNTR